MLARRRLGALPACSRLPSLLQMPASFAGKRSVALTPGSRLPSLLTWTIIFCGDRPLSVSVPLLPVARFSDSEVQRDAKLVSFQIVDKQSKPYIQGGLKGCGLVRLSSGCPCMQRCTAG